jgi:2-oxoglutarate ferredoxin oxidoreductase subunit gamma
MRIDVVMAGLGGQGLMTIGQILAAAAVHEEKGASYLPSYSPEVRGGWANCTVVISSGAVGSPIVGEPSALVALEAGAVLRHAATVRPGGLILVNTSLAPDSVGRDDVRVIGLPATEAARRVGDERAANIVMLGAYVAASGAVALESVEGALRDQLRRRPHLVDLNVRALAEGAAAVRAADAPQPPHDR